MAITGTKGTRAVTTKYPYTSGLTAETTKQEGRKPHLKAQSKSLISGRNKVGL